MWNTVVIPSFDASVKLTKEKFESIAIELIALDKHVFCEHPYEVFSRLQFSTMLKSTLRIFIALDFFIFSQCSYVFSSNRLTACGVFCISEEGRRTFWEKAGSNLTINRLTDLLLWMFLDIKDPQNMDYG